MRKSNRREGIPLLQLLNNVVLPGDTVSISEQVQEEGMGVTELLQMLLRMEKTMGNLEKKCEISEWQ